MNELKDKDEQYNVFLNYNKETRAGQGFKKLFFGFFIVVVVAVAAAFSSNRR